MLKIHKPYKTLVIIGTLFVSGALLLGLSPRVAKIKNQHRRGAQSYQSVQPHLACSVLTAYGTEFKTLHTNVVLALTEYLNDKIEQFHYIIHR